MILNETNVMPSKLKGLKRTLKFYKMNVNITGFIYPELIKIKLPKQNFSLRYYFLVFHNNLHSGFSGLMYLVGWG